MDEYATPIEQIRPDMQNNNQQPQQQIPVNYSDMLQSMETQQNQAQQMQQQEFPPHPIVQSKMPHNSNMNMNFVQQQSKPQEEENNYSQIQKDIMYILIPSILLYSNPVQNQLLKVLPSLFKEERPTILGNVANGIIIAIVFIGIKNMKVNFS